MARVRPVWVDGQASQGTRGSATEPYAREGRDLYHGKQIIAGHLLGYDPGKRSRQFFLHGWRHVNEPARQRIDRLEPGERLYVTIELTNPATRVAVQIQTEDYSMIGWAPRYLVGDLVPAIAESPGEYFTSVVWINPTPAPSKQRLLVQLRGRWPDYEPMSRGDFELLAP